jgi:hypothetical protein
MRNNIKAKRKSRRDEMIIKKLKPLSKLRRSDIKFTTKKLAT